MADYAGVDANGLAVSGMWNSDSLISEDETLVELTGEATLGWTWDGTNWIAPLVSINNVRIERDRLLADCDWRDLPSYPGTDQAAWQTYRQALRDMTEGYTPVASPAWPTEPA